MSNIYVGQMKDAMKSYYRKHCELEKQKKENSSRYVQAVRDKCNQELTAKQADYCNKAKQTINEIYQDVRGKLGRCCYLDSEKLNSDRFLLESGIALSEEEIAMLAEKNKTNFTMLRLLQNYVDSHNDINGEFPMGRYANIKIPLPADSLAVYRRFAQAAIDMCDDIYSDSDSATEAAVEAFGDEKFSGDLYQVIGDGMDLNSKISISAPKNLEHKFDSETLIMETNTNVFVG